ncbi:MAG TPA: hypothetical protein PLW02_10335 [Verrucomicrobiota bacterium]|nr:hypothetical protein [Verrucomicrobiota bacterium]
MSWKNKIKGSVIGLIGFLLSPLSWWNDLVVNIPLAIMIGWLFSLIYKPLFLPAAIFGYWLTNVLGLILLRRGAQTALKEDDAPKPFSKKELIKDILISLAYTGVIIILAKLKIIEPLNNYFSTLNK